MNYGPFYLGCADTLKPDDDRHELFAKQREERGFDNTELWNLDKTIAKFILPRLIAFRDNVAPEGDYASESWRNDLTKMITAFENLSNYDAINGDSQDVYKGLALFINNYRALWY